MEANDITPGTGPICPPFYSALASRRSCSTRNATFSVASNAQRTIHSALASGFALSSKGHVRLALLASSGLVWLATWPSTRESEERRYGYLRPRPGSGTALISWAISPGGHGFLIITLTEVVSVP